MAVELKTYGQMLIEVQTAISAVMNAQRYELGGRMMQRADLEMLNKREQMLIDKLNTYGDVIPTQTVKTGRAYGVSFG